jgi:hypothetical protein
MNNGIIRINVIGKILKGDNKGWYILVKDDFEDTGGFLIFISKDPKFNSDEGCDYWVEQYKNLIGFFKESHWKIQWFDE